MDNGDNDFSARTGEAHAQQHISPAAGRKNSSGGGCFQPVACSLQRILVSSIHPIHDNYVGIPIALSLRHTGNVVAAVHGLD